MKSLKRMLVIGTLAALALVLTFMIIGWLNVSQGILAFVAIQLVAFAVASPQPALFTTMFTDEQEQEWTQNLITIKKGWDRVKDVPEKLAALVSENALLRRDLDDHRRASLKGGFSPRDLRPGQVVTDDCAEYFAGIAIMSAEKQGKLGLSEHVNRDALVSRAGRILSMHHKSSLTPSDIPMPVGYSGQVVSLVSQYGAARRYGTVFPLGTGTVKLPRLKTDTGFGLLTRSGLITEKSPQTEWVTFTAEKFGGLIRLPSEMSEDSIIPLGNFIAEYAARQLAAVEDQVFFLNLDGATYGAVKGLCGSTIDNSKVVQMASTKTAYSDATITNLRAVRNKPDAAALRRAAYYCHPSFEQFFAGFNSAGDRPYNPNSQLAGASAAQPFMTGPTFDGFPIRWVDQMPAYATTANPSKVFILFGDLSFQYLGVTGAGIRIDTSVEAAFDTDEILIRALERFTIGLMAVGAVAGLQTAAS